MGTYRGLRFIPHCSGLRPGRIRHSWVSSRPPDLDQSYRLGMNQPGSCTPDEHRLHRRLFLKGLTATGAAAVTSFTGLFTNPLFAQAAQRAQKKVILLWLCGAPSQFETCLLY